MSPDREHPTISAARTERLRREESEKTQRLRAQMEALHRCFLHPDWGEARRYITGRIDHHRDALEGSKLTPEEIAVVRGQILALRHLLRIADGEFLPLQGAAIDLLKDRTGGAG